MCIKQSSTHFKSFTEISGPYALKISLAQLLGLHVLMLNCFETRWCILKAAVLHPPTLLQAEFTQKS